MPGQAALMRAGLSFPGQPPAVQAETRGADQAAGWDLQLHRPAEEAAEGAVALPQKVSQCCDSTGGESSKDGAAGLPSCLKCKLLCSHGCGEAVLPQPPFPVPCLLFRACKGFAGTMNCSPPAQSSPHPSSGWETHLASPCSLLLSNITA